MSRPGRLTRLPLALFLALTLAGAATAEATRPAQTETAPIPVAQDAPPAASQASGAVAIGAVAGLFGGILLLALIVGSSN